MIGYPKKIEKIISLRVLLKQRKRNPGLHLTGVSANKRLNTWAQGHIYPLLKRASGLTVLHMKPAHDSLFSNGKVMLNGMNKATFIITHCSAFHYNTNFLNPSPLPPPPPHHLRENYSTLTQAIL